MPNFNPEFEKVMHAMLSGVASAEAGKMFGYPAYKVNGKLAITIHEMGIVLKVGQARAKELIEKGSAKSFEPLSGRVWKDWILLTGGFDNSKALFEEAVQYVMNE